MGCERVVEELNARMKLVKDPLSMVNRKTEASKTGSSLRVLHMRCRRRG